MKKVYSYLSAYKTQSVLAPLFKLLEAGLELIVPLVVAAIVDVGIKNGDKTYIGGMFALLCGLGLVGLVASVTAQFFAAKAAVGYSTRLRHALFDKMQSLSFKEIDSLGSATLISRMTGDVNQVQTGVNMVLRLFLRSPFIVFGAMIMAFTISASAGGIFLAVIFALSLIVGAIMGITLPLYKKTQSRQDDLLLTTRENLTGVRVIRAFSKEETEIRTFDKRNALLKKSQNFVGAISALMNPLTYVVVNVGIIILLNFGAIKVDTGVLTQGQVIALYNYMTQILVELIKLANLIITITKALTSANRIEAVFDLNTPLKTSADDTVYTDNAVDFKEVFLSYGGDNALENITFSVKKGETVGIIGGTGSGKSSLVHLIPHFYDATGGEVLVGGVNVQALDTEALRERVGIVLQKAVLFKGTIRENLQWGNPTAGDEELLEAVALAQASDVVRAKGGLDGVVEQGGRNLSGGQKQRLSIARALVKKPEILILDDSASALDYATDKALRHALKNMPFRPTTFIVSQRTASLAHADKIIVLDEGKMVGLGTHAELLENNEVYKEIYYSQYKEEGGATHA